MNGIVITASRKTLIAIFPTQRCVPAKATIYASRKASMGLILDARRAGK